MITGSPSSSCEMIILPNDLDKIISSLVVNVEIDNSLKWVLFNTVSGQTTSDAL